MTHPMKAFSRLIAALAIGASFALPAAAGDGAAGDPSAIHSIIQSQIDAFQQDDGAAAYGFASPTIQQIFPSVGAFMDMVRNGSTSRSIGRAR